MVPELQSDADYVDDVLLVEPESLGEYVKTMQIETGNLGFNTSIRK
jgi:hypothetical protein